MTNYTNLLYNLIGKRIRKLRTGTNLRGKRDNFTRQLDFGFINGSTLSKIENGKASKARNPYFLNAGQICDICNALREQGKNISPDELVWGTKEEKGEYIKMIVLATLLNDTGANPFSTLDFPTWLGTLDVTTREQVTDNQHEMKEVYNYFINPQNHNLFELLQLDSDKSCERISNQILKHLLLDELYFSRFSEYLKDCSRYEAYKYELLVKDYLLNKGSYSGFILRKDNYPAFIFAFRKFWERNQDEYIQFFERELFIGGDVLEKRGMRDIQNEKIHSVLTSPEFLELNEWSLLTLEYSDIGTAVVCTRQRLSMVAMINKDKAEMFCEDEEVDIPNFSH